MKRAFLVSLYMLCLAVGYTTFAKFVDVGNLGIPLKIATGILGTTLLVVDVYFTYRITTKSALKQS